MNEDKTRSKLLLEYLPSVLTFVAILVCAIIFKQSFIKTLPVCFSLVIMLLNSQANRIGFLLGALNSLIYIIGYFMESLYGTVASTFFGMVLSLTAYFRWKKKAYGRATIFRSFSGKQRVLFSVLLVIAWALCSFVLWKIDGSAVVFDGLILVLGVVVPILNIVAFIEAPCLNILSCVAQLTLWGQIVFIDGKIANLTYLIYTAYALYMVVRTFLRWFALYKEQGQKQEKDVSGT